MSYTSNFIKNLSKPVLMGLATTAVGILCTVEYCVGAPISLLVFFIAPLSIAAWFIGIPAGIALAILCSFGRVIFAVASSHDHSPLASIYWNACVDFGVFLAVAILVGKLKVALHSASSSVRTDTLTGIANRRAFFEIANAELSRMNRYKRPFTLGYLDIDDFRIINDNHGHEAGDHLLQCITNVIGATIRSTDLIARIGDDEFAILLPETSEVQAKSAIDKISAALHGMLEKQVLSATYSIGVVTFIRPPATVDDMLTMADHVMHSAKNDGKNTIKYLIWKDSALAQ